MNVDDSPFESVRPPVDDPTGQMLCQLRGCTRPVYPGHSYCSRTHGQQGQRLQHQREAYPTSSANPPYSSMQMQQWSPAHADGREESYRCAYRDCPHPAFPGSDYCSRTHLRQHKEEMDANRFASMTNPFARTVPSSPPPSQQQGRRGDLCMVSGCRQPKSTASRTPFCPVHVQEHHRTIDDPSLPKLSLRPMVKPKPLCSGRGCANPAFGKGGFCSQQCQTQAKQCHTPNCTNEHLEHYPVCESCARRMHPSFYQ